MLIADQEAGRQHTAPGTAIHQVAADQQVHHAGQGIEDDVLVRISVVFFARTSPTEHGEARRHPHHQGTADQQIEGVQRIPEESEPCFPWGTAVPLHIAPPLARKKTPGEPGVGYSCGGLQVVAALVVLGEVEANGLFPFGDTQAHDQVQHLRITKATIPV